MRLMLIFLLALQLQAGGFSCSSVCLSKVASAVSIAANGKTIVAGWKKLRHPKRKAVPPVLNAPGKVLGPAVGVPTSNVLNPHPELNPPGSVLDLQWFPVSWPTPDCVGSGCVAKPEAKK